MSMGCSFLVTGAEPARAKEFLVTSWSKGLLPFHSAFRVTETQTS